MNLYRQKIYELTHWSHEARALASILIRTYSNNHKDAYDILAKIQKNGDRTRLLKYIDKPGMSKQTIKKIVDTFCFYRVTLQNNPEFKRIYMTNNPRCTEHQRFHQMRKLKTILERAYDYDIEKVQKVLNVLPNEQDQLKLLKYIDKTPYLSNKCVRKMVQIYVIYNIDLPRPNNQEDRKLKPAKSSIELFKEREERDLILAYWSDLHFISHR